MKTILVIGGMLICAAVMPGAQSIAVGGTGAVYSANYSGSPWDSFGSYSSRVEIRIDNLQLNKTISCVANGFCFNATSTAFCSSFQQIGDVYAVGSPSGPQACALISLTAGISVIARAQRDLTKANCVSPSDVGCWTVQVWTIPTFAYAQGVTDVTSVNANWTTWGENTAVVNSGGSAVAWMEWFTGVVPLGQGSAFCGSSPRAACIPDATDSETGDLGSWKFEGGLTDSSGHGYNLVLATAITYTATPVYNPTCNPGVQQTFRAGLPATLSGFGVPLDGVTKTIGLVWQQIAGPPLTWTGQRTGTPTLDGIVATNVPGGPPSYVFRLTCSDGLSNSTTVSIKDGAVATDGNGVVITNNPLLDGWMHQQLMWGATSLPWPWEDDRAMYMATTILNGQYGLGNPPRCTSTNPATCPFQPWWTYYGAGTVSLTDGSATLSGNGTHFLTTFNCTAGNAPASTGVAAVEYMGGNGGVLPATLHYAGYYIASCTDDTHAVLNQPWYGFRGTPTGHWAADTTGYQYQWSFNGNAQFPGDFYENATAFYNHFVRTGLDDFYQAAYQMAQWWWTQPSMDQGSCFAGFLSGSQSAICQGTAARAFSELDIWLLAQLNGDHKCTDAACSSGTGVWAGLRYLYDSAAFQFMYDINASNKAGDRETAHLMTVLAICAVNDPLFKDSYYGQTCQQTLDYALSLGQYFTDPTTGGLLDGPMGYDGGYGTASLMAGGGSYQGTGSWGSGYGETVTLTNGSTTVTCNDGTQGHPCAWQSTTSTPWCAWLWVLNNPYSSFVTTGSIQGMPENFSAGLSGSYAISSIAGPRTLTLSSPFTGPSGTYLYSLSILDNTGLPCVNGFYIQPYMSGISGDAFYRVSDALSSIGDNANASIAAVLGKSASTFNTKYAIDPSLGGAAYITNSLNCPVGTFPHEGNCDMFSTDQWGSRILNIETSMAGNAEYLHDGSSSVKRFIDGIMNNAWAKPGTCNGDTACNPDGYYIGCLEPAGPVGGYCLTWAGAPWKWFGQFFGSSMGPSWGATRLGGLQSSPSQIVYVPFGLAGIPGAAKVVVTRTGTDGLQTSTTCTASPCAISITRTDNVQGAQVRLQYLNGAGRVLATSSTPVVIR